MHPENLGRARLAGDDGTALIEAAIITPLFMYLLFGILEFGLLFFAATSTNAIVLAGARQEAIQGVNLNADYLSLQAMKSAAGVLDRTRIQRIVIWHPLDPTPANSSVPSGCAAGTATGNPGVAGDFTVLASPTTNTVGWCNVYTAANLDQTSTSFGCGATQPDRFWCPTVRRNANTGPKSADYVGVYMVYRYKFLTGLFGTSRDVSFSAISRIEPQAVS
jgi:Flp pilus assembly protein TadG